MLIVGCYLQAGDLNLKFMKKTLTLGIFLIRESATLLLSKAFIAKQDNNTIFKYLIHVQTHGEKQNKLL